LPANVNWTGYALVAAVAVLIGFAVSSLAYRFHLLIVPDAPVIQRMVQELNLTPAQHDQIQDIMESTWSRMIDLRRDFEHRRRAEMLDAYANIRKLLNPSQQVIFDRDFPVPPLPPLRTVQRGQAPFARPSAWPSPSTQANSGPPPTDSRSESTAP